MELRLPGANSRWLVRVSDTTRDGDLAAFADRHAGLAATASDGDFLVNDPDYGPVRFCADGRVEAEGRVLNPREWSIAGEATKLPLRQG